MKKQVEGHTSKQAPCNRQIYTTDIYFTKFVNGCNPTYTKDLATALKWYKCGSCVSVVITYDGFKIDRPQRFEKTNTSQGEAISGYQKGYEEYDGMLSRYFEKVYATWYKAWKQEPTTKQLDYINKAKYNQVQVNTF